MTKMITDEYLTKLYDRVIYQERITKKSLLDIGFEIEDITNLIKEKKLKQIANEYYTFQDYSGLSLYYLELLHRKDNDKRYLCCLELNKLKPGRKNILENIFYQSLIRNDRKKIGLSLMELYPFDKSFYGWCYTLLNRILPMPNIILNTDIIDPDEHFKAVSIEAINGSIPYAISLLHKIPNTGYKYNIYNIILKKVAKVEKKEKGLIRSNNGN